jgi:hypothetical protein
MLPEIYQGTGTYINDMRYHYINTEIGYQDCIDYLTRKISQLDKKIVDHQGHDNKNKYMMRWHNQKAIYEAMLNYLSLRKLPLSQCQ